jgi:hypothetical protein
MSYTMPCTYSKVVDRIIQIAPNGMSMDELNQYSLIQLNMIPLNQLLDMCYETGAIPYLHSALCKLLTPTVVQSIVNSDLNDNHTPVDINVETLIVEIEAEPFEPIVAEPIIDEPIIDEPIIDEPIVDEPIVATKTKATKTKATKTKATKTKATKTKATKTKAFMVEQGVKPVCTLAVEMDDVNNDNASYVSVTSCNSSIPYASVPAYNNDTWTTVNKTKQHVYNKSVPNNSPNNSTLSTWKAGVSRRPELMRTSTSASYAFKKQDTEPVIPKDEDHYAHFGKMVKADNGEMYELPIGWWYVKGMKWTYKINYMAKFAHTLLENHTWSHFEIVDRTDDDGNTYETYLPISTDRMLWIITPYRIRTGPCPM